MVNEHLLGRRRQRIRRIMERVELFTQKETHTKSVLEWLNWRDLNSSNKTNAIYIGTERRRRRIRRKVWVLAMYETRGREWKSLPNSNHWDNVEYHIIRSSIKPPNELCHANRTGKSIVIITIRSISDWVQIQTSLGALADWMLTVRFGRNVHWSWTANIEEHLDRWRMVSPWTDTNVNWTNSGMIVEQNWLLQAREWTSEWEWEWHSSKTLWFHHQARIGRTRDALVACGQAKSQPSTRHQAIHCI